MKMKRRQVLKALSGIAFWEAVSPATKVRKMPKDRPNVVLILTDDQGWWDLGCYGNPYIETPNIDKIAKEGVQFMRFYATPVCTPTRACLMTGRYFQRTGAIDTFMGRDTMSKDEITLAEIFKECGYKTALVGKWHLGRYMRYHPNNRGFDEFFGFWQYGFINRYFDSDELFYQNEQVFATGYITDVLTDFAANFIRENSDRPFFLFLSYNAPHFPYFVPDKYVEHYLRKGLPLRDAQIYGMITCIDENVGQILKTIEECGIDENTIIIFMSDNGGVSNWWKGGLRGSKGTVYEGGIRVPFIARWKGHFPRGIKVNAMAHVIDIFPTFCELLGVSPKSDRKIDGKSILQILLKGSNETPHEALFFQWTRVKPNPDKNWAIISGKYKLINGELYDLESDPSEKRDISAQNPEVVRELRGKFEAWFEEVTSGQSYERVPIEIGREDENPVEIDITWGEAFGGVTIRHERYIRDRAENWGEIGDFVRWKIEAVKEGIYEVTLAYSCPPKEAGSIFRISIGNSHIDCKVEPTPDWEVFQKRVVGKILVPRGQNFLEIRPVSIKGKELMKLHKIWLKLLK